MDARTREIVISGNKLGNKSPPLRRVASVHAACSSEFEPLGGAIPCRMAPNGERSRMKGMVGGAGFEPATSSV